MNSKIKEIDGSILEGGGQILRMVLSFSAILRVPVRIKNIRSGRAQGGLKAQHLTGVKLMQQICNAEIEGAEIGSQILTFIPHNTCGGEFRANTGTAGSVALLLQVALPACYYLSEPVHLQLIGGTNCEMAPQIDYLTEVFRPNLEKFGGATFDFDLVRRGYFPKGGGEVSIHLNPVKWFQPLILLDPGDPIEIFGWSFVAGSLPIRLAHDMANSAIDVINRNVPNVNVNIERYKEDPKITEGNCSGIILVCKTSTGCILGGSALGNRRNLPSQTGFDAAVEILDCLKQRACVDKYTQDMVIIFMALAAGRSAIQIGEVTLHTKTAIHVAENMTEATFTVKPNGPETNIIECNGIGYKNLSLQ